ncbi:MAG TPA: glycoside hydrolase family 97 N-terminal domain-containing protein, partial [Cyclobacteriaceae bacterium]|nr:glycoside hydrolase family 97 N-terminal domain-containing protein [Cyclobacteriaceae bacterium]
MNIHTLSPLLIILAIFSLVGCAQKEINWDLKSPDKSIKILLTWQTNDTTLSELSYKVISESDSGSVTVIMNSPLGITREDQDFSRGLIPGKERNVSESDETYKMITGKASEIRNHFNALTVPFTTASGKMMEIDLRAYDDGIAFRYRFPENDSMVYTVTGESTGFTIPMSGKSWIQPYDAVTQYSPAYETYYGNGIEISSKSPGREGWSFPALFETKGFWILITEANLGPNFYGAHLQPEAGGGLYQIRLPEKEEARRLYPAEPISTLPWTSPWRMAIIGKTPAAIIESNLVNNLNDPSIVEDQSWIKPGKASWSWWSDNPSPTDYQKQTVFVDLAATMGWEYILVDANWDR